MWEIKQVSHDFLGKKKGPCMTFAQHKVHHIAFSIASDIMAEDVKNYIYGLASQEGHGLPSAC